MSLYHAEYGIPKRIRTSWGMLTLDYAFLKEKSPMLNLNAYPNMLDTDTAEVIEVEDDKLGFTKKVLYRLPFTLTDDMVIVLLPYVDVMEDKKEGIVLDLFYVGVDKEVRKTEYYANYLGNKKE